ncbi:MAG: ribonuclease HI family protein [Acidobacteriota bacterium]|nr:ribonuclease HI family protein [Acidobacteriota bacterium]
MLAESPPVSYIVHIDGASRGNPGPASFAAIIETADGKPVISIAKKLGSTTNNFAEYQALLAALEFAASHNPQKVAIFSDSELLVRQIQGRYRVKSEALKPLHARAMELIEGLAGFSITHVLRAKNREADRLANLALDGKC